MLLFDGALGLLALAVWIFCIVDVITTPEHQARNLPKLVWLLIVLLFADIGSIVWLVAGRPWPARSLSPSAAHPAKLPSRTPTRPVAPDDDEQFLAGLRARAEEQRRRAEEKGRDVQQDEPPAPTA
ncbi:MAG TPA: PLD nuclease N-terminal domain-containing protein [Jatrophihabitans sp.]|nr:PLD nuclease N-terminal domain-containing protein [Jatrophihabitans sp.]